MKINLKALIISVLVPLGLGWLAGMLSGDSMSTYQELIKPALSPPGWLFGVVWPILYVLMGVASYLIFTSRAPEHEKSKTLKLYAVQLVVNFLWSFIFFNLELYLLAFIWLLLLWVLIVLTIINMYPISKTAAYLMLPYLLWVTFAGYLNLSIVLLN